MFENPKSSKAILSPRAFLCCLATPDDKNITILVWFEKEPYVPCISGTDKRVYMGLYAYTLFIVVLKFRK